MNMSWGLFWSKGNLLVATPLRKTSLLPLATTQPTVPQEEMETHEPFPHPLWNVDRLHLMPVTRAAVCSRLHDPA